VPISLKDQFHVKDVETTMGYVGWINTYEGIKDSPKKKTYESEMVRELRNLGAVLYVKTSVPHTLMSGETINNIIGYTWNPKNRNLCSGGSSGGEGALIGLRGSPGGFGTDIGGSIRIPAGFNGLFGIRPSGGRLPYEGMANSMDGQNSVLSVVGPLATSARATTFLVKSILSQQPWLYDPLVVDMPWREDVVKETEALVKGSSEKVCFAIMKSDGIVNPQPTVARALQMCVDALEKEGHKVIEWQPPAHASHEHGLSLTFKTWLYDGGKDIHDAFALSGEPISKQISMTYGDKPGNEFTASEISKNNVEKRQWQKDYMDYWNSTAELTGTGRPVDGVICPLAPYPAAMPEQYKYYGYSAFINGLDYTSVVVPVTEADKSVDKVVEGYKPMNDQDKTAYENYDPEVYDGAHVSVQLFGRRLQEEKMLVLGEYLGELLGKANVSRVK
jgi:amidase